LRIEGTIIRLASGQSATASIDLKPPEAPPK